MCLTKSRADLRGSCHKGTVTATGDGHSALPILITAHFSKISTLSLLESAIMSIKRKKKTIKFRVTFQFPKHSALKRRATWNFFLIKSYRNDQAWGAERRQKASLCRCTPPFWFWIAILSGCLNYYPFQKCLWFEILLITRKAVKCHYTDLGFKKIMHISRAI